MTWHQCPSGRIVARLGEIEIGAVFPDKDGSARWRFFLDRSFADQPKAKSELAARNALATTIADWLRRAGLKENG